MTRFSSVYVFFNLPVVLMTAAAAKRLVRGLLRRICLHSDYALIVRNGVAVASDSEKHVFHQAIQSCSRCLRAKISRRRTVETYLPNSNPRSQLFTGKTPFPIPPAPFADTLRCWEGRDFVGLGCCLMSRNWESLRRNRRGPGSSCCFLSTPRISNTYDKSSILLCFCAR